VIKEHIQLPTHAEVVAALLAYRYNLPGGVRHVWLCVTDDRGWFTTDEKGEIEGAYARCMVGKGDSNGVVHDAATMLIGTIRDYLEKA
jgi:hypothetical protein